MGRRGAPRDDPAHALPQSDHQVLAEWLFLETLADLRERVERDDVDRYRTLGIAALLRSLLVEGRPLMERVNAQHKLPVRFGIHAYTPGGDQITPGPQYQSRFELAGYSLLSEPRKLVNRESLLRTVVGESPGHGPLTVRELIKHYANTEGAVHLGQPKTHFERVLMESIPFAIRLGVPAEMTPLASLLALGLVVLRGLGDLEAAVREQGTEASGASYEILVEPGVSNWAQWRRVGR